MKSNASIIYFLTRSCFLGFGIGILFYYSGKDSYLGAMLGLLLGLIITYFYNYVISFKKGSLNDLYKSNKIMGVIARVLLGIASFIIMIYSLVLYTTFTISFLLTTTPELYVLIPFLIIAIYLAFKGLKVITRVANVLMPFSIIAAILAFLGLSALFVLPNFEPILTTTPLSFLKTALTFAGISTFPNILILHFNNETKNNLKVYILAGILIIATMICVNGVFGEALTKIFRFPEYMVLKQLKVFNFIEKVENIFSLIWVVDLFITLTMCIYSIKETLPYKFNKQITIGIIIASAFLIDRILGFNYVLELEMYYILPIVALVLGISIIIIFMYLVKHQAK